MRFLSSLSSDRETTDGIVFIRSPGPDFTPYKSDPLVLYLGHTIGAFLQHGFPIHPRNTAVFFPPILG